MQSRVPPGWLNSRQPLTRPGECRRALERSDTLFAALVSRPAQGAAAKIRSCQQGRRGQVFDGRRRRERLRRAGQPFLPARGAARLVRWTAVGRERPTAALEARTTTVACQRVRTASAPLARALRTAYRVLRRLRQSLPRRQRQRGAPDARAHGQARAATRRG